MSENSKFYIGDWFNPNNINHVIMVTSEIMAKKKISNNNVLEFDDIHQINTIFQSKNNKISKSNDLVKNVYEIIQAFQNNKKSEDERVVIIVRISLYYIVFVCTYSKYWMINFQNAESGYVTIKMKDSFAENDIPKTKAFNIMAVYTNLYLNIFNTDQLIGTTKLMKLFLNILNDGVLKEEYIIHNYILYKKEPMDLMLSILLDIACIRSLLSTDISDESKNKLREILKEYGEYKFIRKPKPINKNDTIDYIIYQFQDMIYRSYKITMYMLYAAPKSISGYVDFTLRMYMLSIILNIYNESSYIQKLTNIYSITVIGLNGTDELIYEKNQVADKYLKIFTKLKKHMNKNFFRQKFESINEEFNTLYDNIKKDTRRELHIESHYKKKEDVINAEVIEKKEEKKEEEKINLDNVDTKVNKRKIEPIIEEKNIKKKSDKGEEIIIEDLNKGKKNITETNSKKKMDSNTANILKKEQIKKKILY